MGASSMLALINKSISGLWTETLLPNSGSRRASFRSRSVRTQTISWCLVSWWKSQPNKQVSTSVVGTAVHVVHGRCDQSKHPCEVTLISIPKIIAVPWCVSISGVARRASLAGYTVDGFNTASTSSCNTWVTNRVIKGNKRFYKSCALRQGWHLFAVVDAAGERRTSLTLFTHSQRLQCLWLAWHNGSPATLSRPERIPALRLQGSQGRRCTLASGCGLSQNIY